MSADRAAMGRKRATATLLASLACAAALSGCGREDAGPVVLGGRDVKAWVADMHNARPQVRRQAVLKLGNIGDSDPSVAEALAGALNDPEVLVRREAILAVARFKQPSAAIRERLQTMGRSDKDPRARDLAGKALIRLGGVE